jgi:hypothetical protein
MINIKIDVPLLFDGTDQRVKAELDAALDKIENRLISNVKAGFFTKNKVATGKTSKSIGGNRQILTNRLSLEISAMGNRARAMQAIELGRGRNKPQPPTDPIIQWMEAKGIGEGLSESKRKSLAFVIARSIGERGIKPEHIFRDAIDDSDVQAIQRIIEEGLRKAISKLR